MTSQARIDANRLNAQKSTGPKSKEGKERSRQNALKHGLRAEVLELPDEQDVIAARVLGWATAFRPSNDPERWLVARAAAASVKLDRCTELEAARINRRARKVRARLVDGRRAEAEQLAEMVGAIDEAPVRLRATALGCEALLGLLDELESSFESPEGWGPEQSLRLGNLLGYPNGTMRPHPELVGLIEEAGRVARGDADAAARLRQRIAGARAELEARGEELWEEVDGPELREALALARFDSSKLAARMQRYEAMHSADLNRCLRQIKAGVGAPNEPNITTQTLPHQELTPEEAPLAPVTSAPPAASSIPDPSIPHPSPPTPSPAAPNEANARAQAPRKPQPYVPMEWRSRLAVDPAISRAWPVVKGTSITASQIGGLLTPPNAMTRPQIVAHFGGRITLEDIQAACDFLNDRGGTGHYED